MPKPKSTTPGGPISLETDDAIYFWKPEGPHGWLGQWHESAFGDDVDESIVYPTAEHYMMYQKAILFKDHTVAQEILSATKPRKVKGLGRKVQPFDDETWCANREKIVRRGTVLKFTRAVDEAEREDLRGKLLATGDKELVEASPMDRVWGVGFGAVNASRVENRRRWGMNLLGKILMEVRGELRAKKEEEEKRKKQQGEEEEESKA